MSVSGVLLGSLLVVTLVQALVLLVALRTGRWVVADTAWGPGFVAVAVVAVLLGGGEGLRSGLVVLLTGLWALRLAWHLHRRNHGRGEDPRYAELLARAPAGRTAWALRKVHLPQGAVMWVVSLPVQVAVLDADHPGPLLWLGVGVWAVGLLFEAVGDAQLDRFRRDPANRGRVLDTGLWRLTRHPNYFGDACVWWGMFLLAADTGAWWTVLSPLLMTWVLARGTGKPLLERDIGQRRPAYADYVRRTSGFVPLPPRRTPA